MVKRCSRPSSPVSAHWGGTTNWLKIKLDAAAAAGRPASTKRAGAGTNLEPSPFFGSNLTEIASEMCCEGAGGPWRLQAVSLSAGLDVLPWHFCFLGDSQFNRRSQTDNYNWKMAFRHLNVRCFFLRMLPIDKKTHYQKFKHNKNLRKEPQWVMIHFFFYSKKCREVSRSVLFNFWGFFGGE